ncbi:P-loop NTPase fold protein [Methylomonas sp. MO1]|uniref:KAP family P-loop NTPase fold protein n=1 Tax=Methylomonas sp. MO1 TaxID=3073619 RepID=UPI0028A3EB7C|nr:P-loop NTPase fold protein [Methylomonas sp. MO1]MDT4288029.1 P-loop NTPase fold protein [Methylomonas sp. MO1]
MKNITEWEGDVLQRRKYALFLTRYLINKNSSSVINITAPWGSGKTFFMERWFQDIKINHPAVYFNAWQNDYSNDPLISLISSIISQILSLNEEGQQTEATTNLLKKSSAIIKKLSPMIVKGILRKYIGEDGLEEFSKTTKDTEDTIADISGKLTEELLENFKQTENLIAEFKKSISALIENPSNKKLQKPLFIFIDELDRCRPNFAIELLEKIKHIFNIEDVIFIIATDTRQLSYSIKAIYGQDFNGETYLRSPRRSD